MSDTELQPVSSPAPGTAPLSSTWRFIKVTLLVIVGLGLLVVALSPRLYTGVNKNSPEYWQAKAKEYVSQKKYQEAIDAYKRVLSFEPDRQQIFVKASHQIKSLQQLQSARQESADSPGEGTVEEEPAEEENGPAEDETESAEGDEPTESETRDEGAGETPPMDDSMIP